MIVYKEYTRELPLPPLSEFASQVIGIFSAYVFYSLRRRKTIGEQAPPPAFNQRSFTQLRRVGLVFKRDDTTSTHIK